MFLKTFRSNISNVDEITVKMGYVISYVDDVLIHGKTELQVQEYTQEIISTTQNTGFKANHDKTHLVESEAKHSEIV